MKTCALIVGFWLHPEPYRGEWWITFEVEQRDGAVEFSEAPADVRNGAECIGTLINSRVEINVPLEFMNTPRLVQHWMRALGRAQRKLEELSKPA